ncbi:PstS family phosphate ABC transporter substrate-binding protein [Streptomyces sp. NPDC059568]|uniref:PstS family phosphate ABC transporter substrate-binding protein n=1 Tax=Streptomyces sp. NPDC059568 TaxID=3346868 RepID=UPI0036C192C9
MDEWLTAENVLATLSALLGLAATAVTVWYRPRAPHRKRIGYRVQMDTPFGRGNDAGEGQGLTTVRVGAFSNFLEGMADATVVLLRIENDGAESIVDSDYTSRDALHGLTVVFADRTVRGVAVTQPEDNAEYLMEHFVPSGPAGIQYSDREIRLPRIPLNRDQHFKLLILLTGGPVNSGVRVTGGLQGGDVVPNKGVSVDEKPPLFSRHAKWITGILAAYVMVLTSVLVWPRDTVPPRGCEKGKLTLVGSTAFSQAATALELAYEKDCPGSEIEIRMTGTQGGLDALAAAGRKEPDSSPAMIAFSDGLKTRAENYVDLKESFVALSAYTLVVNSSVKLPEQGLSRRRVQQIFAGEHTNWSELDGGTDDIKLISREGDSGTRDIFERKVLRGTKAVDDTSRDCETLRSGYEDAPIVHCERDSTNEVLDAVARIPGALGYSELQSFKKFQDKSAMTVLRLDDVAPPSTADIGASVYPFTEVEYAYTYRSPLPGSLTDSFLTFMTREGGQSIVEHAGHAPCERITMYESCRKKMDDQLRERHE